MDDLPLAFVFQSDVTIEGDEGELLGTAEKFARQPAEGLSDDGAFVRKLTDAFAQYEAAQRDGWHGATELGRAAEEEAAALAAEGVGVRALLATC